MFSERVQRQPTLQLGRIVATPGALKEVSQADIAVALHRHSSRDWGLLCDEDKAANDQALVDQTRILSAYESSTGKKFWIITEADRLVTTILLPEEY